MSNNSSDSQIHILITGGAGFIGSNLAEHLVQTGIRVTVLDNLLTGKIENISHLMDLNCLHSLKEIFVIFRHAKMPSPDVLTSAIKPHWVQFHVPLMTQSQVLKLIFQEP